MKLRNIVLACIIAAAPLASSAVAMASPTPVPVPKFPMPSDGFRKYVDTLISRVRENCDAQCNEKERSEFEGAVGKVRVRVLEACRDGTVTMDEAEWVLQPIDDVGN